MPSTASPVRRTLRARLLARFWELVRFGSVGGIAFVIDTGVFNLLVHGPGEVLGHKPLVSKVIAVAVATVFSWVGNRYWTFSDRKTANRVREFVGFAVVNVGGMLIAVACLAFSRYVLGLTSVLADNISGSVVGLLLGMVFRYLAYRSFVFTAGVGDDVQPGAGPGTVPGMDSGSDLSMDSGSDPGSYPGSGDVGTSGERAPLDPVR
ncbi:GtrA family protein [Sanguibacter sp. A247]|uniref:GtrA family protein n=1 Tax=unclassified Sanguibacter TaxID=2645534 RepID=UPI003FD8EA08